MGEEMGNERTEANQDAEIRRLKADLYDIQQEMKDPNLTDDQYSGLELDRNEMRRKLKQLEDSLTNQ
jgi:predicted  nucleic acid-binding Zn-ribbon protein